MPELKLLGGPGAPRVIHLSPDLNEWVVGTGLSCQVVLEDPMILDRHVCILRKGSGFTIEPIEAGGELRVNGQEREGLNALEADDEILIGHSQIRWIPNSQLQETASDIAMDDSIASFQAVPRPTGMFQFSSSDLLELTSDKGAARTHQAEEIVSGDHLMDALHQVVAAMRAGLSIPEGAMASLASAFGADRVLLYLPVKQSLELIACFLGPAELSAEEGLTTQLLQDIVNERKPRQVDIEGLGRAEREKRYLMAVPIEFGSKEGILALDTPASFRVFQQQDYDVLSAFGFNLSYVLSTRQQTRSLERRVQRWSDAHSRLVDAPPGGWPQEIETRLQAVAKSPKPVLILGEQGVGKRLAGQFLHSHSGRTGEPCLVINCAAEEDIARTLFGFSDLSEGEDQPGALEITRRGTLVLAHATALPMAVQNRLERYLTSGIFQSEGEPFKRRSGARLVFTSHLDPGQSGGAGWFLESLYRWFKRDRVIRIASFREDLGALEQATRVLVSELARLRKRVARDLSSEAWELLKDHPWPGNLVELRTVLGEAVERSRGDCIEAEALRGLLHRS